MVEHLANSGDPDPMPHSLASDLGLHCFPVTLLGVSSLQWIIIPHHTIVAGYYGFILVPICLSVIRPSIHPYFHFET